MDETLTAPLPMAIVGVSTVFFALLAIITVVSINGYLIERGKRPAATAAEVTAGTAGEVQGNADLRPIAIAAYALHLRRSALAITGPPEPSRWAMAGRVRHASSFQR